MNADANLTETTLHWRGPHAGTAVGKTLRIQGRWSVIEAVEAASTRCVTEQDEDMGNGKEGDDHTTQKVSYRPATAAEAAEEKGSRKAAKAARDPHNHKVKWVQANGAELVPGHEARDRGLYTVEWDVRAEQSQTRDQSRGEWAVGTLPDGTPVGRLETGYESEYFTA